MNDIKLYSGTTIFLLFCLTANAQMTGISRENFIDSYTKSCFNSQRSASVNNGASDKVLQQYCNCSSIYTSNMLNNALAKSIENGEQQINQNIVQLAAKYCMNNYQKY